MPSKVIELVGVVKFLSIADSKCPPHIIGLRVMPHPSDFNTKQRYRAYVAFAHTHTCSDALRSVWLISSRDWCNVDHISLSSSFNRLPIFLPPSTSFDICVKTFLVAIHVCLSSETKFKFIWIMLCVDLSATCWFSEFSKISQITRSYVLQHHALSSHISYMILSLISPNPRQNPPIMDGCPLGFCLSSKPAINSFHVQGCVCHLRPLSLHHQDLKDSVSNDAVNHFCSDFQNQQII